MSRRSRIAELLFFLLRFLLLAPVLVTLWWSLLPIYGQILVQLSGGFDHYVLGMPIIGVAVESGGILNTDTNLKFQIATPDGQSFFRSCPAALLVTNVVPYLALVLASSGLTMRRRLAVLAYGSGIIMFTHLLYVIVFLRFKEALMQNSEIVTSTLQFFLVLPFLLWIWFVYSERLSGYLSDDDDSPAPAEKR